MSKFPHFKIDDHWILAGRGQKNKVDPYKPYAYMVEKERTASGKIEDTAIIFLTNSECPFHCLLCDLWKNTTDEQVPVGAIPKQIEWALGHLSPVKHLKLYNNGNFFDTKAIPEQDYERIASLVKNFETLIVENHPKLINKKCIDFRDLIKPDFQIGIGLETVHPEILQKMNKHMNIKDFEKAVNFLNKNTISVRAFILLRLPFMTEEEGIYWAKKSIDFAFKTGIECCTIIPTRLGNGPLDMLAKNNYFSPPHINSLEEVLEYGIQLKAGRVFADMWNSDAFSICSKCLNSRTKRLIEMNLQQKVLPKIKCDCV